MSELTFQLLSDAAKTLPLPFVILDEDGRIIFRSTMAEEMLPPVGSEALAGLAGSGEAAVRLSADKTGSVEGVFHVYPLAGEGGAGTIAIFHPDEGEEKVLAPETLPFVSEKMKETLERIKRMARIDATVLFVGENGVLKEEFAHYLHKSAGRAPFPFIGLDCRESMHDMLEAALFGMEGEAGLLELCAGGTIYLDEISSMPMVLQMRLLGIIRTRELTSASGEDIPFTTRIIASTSRDLYRRVEEGLFSEELLVRIGSMPVEIPPLRECPEDIFPLANHFLKQQGRELRFSKDAERSLMTYYWPGNLRELSSAVAYAAKMCPDGEIRAKHLPFRPQRNLEGLDNSFKRGRIEALLKLYGDSVDGKKRAAKELGIGLSTLYRILKD